MKKEERKGRKNPCIYKKEVLLAHIRLFLDVVSGIKG